MTPACFPLPLCPDCGSPCVAEEADGWRQWRCGTIETAESLLRTKECRRREQEREGERIDA